MPNALTQLLGADPRLYLTYTGMETDLIFTQGIDLPEFASFPLLETTDGRERLRGYYVEQMALATRHDVGTILEAPIWVANRDRAAPLGYGTDALHDLNRAAIGLIADARDQFPDTPAILSANVGPRSDAYAPDGQMDADEAEAYHADQINAFVGTRTDVVSGYTLTYPAEAIGIARAARTAGFPSVIAFTVETDGRLPTGTSLEDAVEMVDQATDSAPAYYMINCAHPDHFSEVLAQSSRLSRIKGIVANASRCSHAELDEAEELDAGNPQELGAQLAQLRQDYPWITVLGGCCGTDAKHLDEIALAVAKL